MGTEALLNCRAFYYKIPIMDTDSMDTGHILSTIQQWPMEPLVIFLSFLFNIITYPIEDNKVI